MRFGRLPPPPEFLPARTTGSPFTHRILLLGCLATAAFFARPASAFDVYLSCAVRAVATFEDRVHVLCNEPYAATSISYFAAPASDRALASRVESIGLVAQVTGTPVRIYFTLADTSGAEFGCGTGDCRRLAGIELFGLGPLGPTASLVPNRTLAAITVPEPAQGVEAMGAIAGCVAIARRRRAG